ncbi:hypothetical protein Nepgr_012450 [Nepenthes gracilis]|uniref:Uncharacterized protein n=1 Tax=Nepenthes gracilis TaxID=150966 RepID=A0AAD3SHA7_NEPGR|nr:hypothetical protein Nepgr_012450 [Nepenthes gracilis]
MSVKTWQPNKAMQTGRKSHTYRKQDRELVSEGVILPKRTTSSKSAGTPFWDIRNHPPASGPVFGSSDPGFEPRVSASVGEGHPRGFLLGALLRGSIGSGIQIDDGGQSPIFDEVEVSRPAKPSLTVSSAEMLLERLDPVDFGLQSFGGASVPNSVVDQDSHFCLFDMFYYGSWPPSRWHCSMFSCCLYHI